MRFWDSSAIIPLCLKESASEDAKDLLKGEEDIVVWWTTRIECLSALSRRQREKTLPSGDGLKAKTILNSCFIIFITKIAKLKITILPPFKTITTIIALCSKKEKASMELTMSCRL